MYTAAALAAINSLDHGAQVLVAQFITRCRAALFGDLSAEFTIGAIGRLRVEARAFVKALVGGPVLAIICQEEGEVRDRTVVDGLLHLAHVTHLTVSRS